MRMSHHLRAYWVRRISALGVIAILGLGLASCFSANEPLITAGASDHPLTPGAKFTEAVNCASVALGCDSQIGYRPIGGGSVEMEDGHYVLHYDPNSNVAFSLPAAQGKNKVSVLFKSIGQDLYIAQLDGGPQEPVKGQDAPQRYLYELVRMQGSDLYIYNYTCEENGDLAYVKSGQLKAITSVLGVAICEPSNLDGLAAVFRARLTNGAPPSERLQLKPGYCQSKCTSHKLR